MATKTPNLGLIKPAFKEFVNTWWKPLNGNFDIIDDAIGSTNIEIATARGSEATLNDRLSVSLNDDGSLIGPPEVVAARNTSVYGNVDGSSNPFTLKSQIEQTDREILAARQGAASLNDGVARLSDDDVSNTVLTAPVGFLTFTGAVVTCDGSVTPVVANINGYRQVVRTQKTTTISGGAGTYYIYLQRNAAGDLFLDRTGVGQNTGQVTTYPTSGFLQQFVDSTQNFVTSGVQPGDILEITSVSSPNKDKFIVASVIDPNTLVIIGLFVSTQSSLNYKITNPNAPSLGFTATAHSKTFTSVANKVFIGRAVFDGANVTGVTIYALKGRFEQFFSVTPSGGDFSQLILHNLGYAPRKVEFYGAQVSDYSQPMDPLSVAGGTGLTRSVVANVSDLQINVKNAVNGVFYQDYAGTSFTSGFILVRAER